MFDETVRTLRDGKPSLRWMGQRASIEEKLLDLWRGQHAYVQIVRSRRPLRSWERPWDIMSDVRDDIVILDGTINTGRKPTPIGSSRSQWIRPNRPWVLAR